MAFVIECTNVSKDFKRTYALKNVNIGIEKDKIYGLLGRNGAGKSTLLNLIASQMFPSNGEIKVFGKAPYENRDVLKDICLIKESGTFIKDIKVKDALYIASLFYQNWDKNLAKKLVEDFELDTEKTFKSLSLGMKSQVSIIVGLSSRAPLTIFDEPYIGLDAPGRQFFYDSLIEDYSENPRTIIISTHLIDEVSNLLEEVIILHKGEVRLTGNIDDIREKAFYLNGSKEKMQAYLQNKNVLAGENIGNNMVAAVFDNITSNEKTAMESDGLNIKSISLQQLFINLTGGKIIKGGGSNE